MLVKTVVIALALSDIYSPSGSLIEPLDGSIARFDAAVAGIPNNDSTVIVATAGYHKTAPLVPRPNRPVSLAKQLERYVETYRPKWYPLLIAEPRGYGTYPEIWNGVRLAIEKGDADPNLPTQLVIATNWLHTWRVKLYCKRLKLPPRWTVEVRCAKHVFTWHSKRREVAAYVTEFLKFWPGPTDWWALRSKALHRKT